MAIDKLQRMAVYSIDIDYARKSGDPNIKTAQDAAKFALAMLLSTAGRLLETHLTINLLQGSQN